MGVGGLTVVALAALWLAEGESTPPRGDRWIPAGADAPQTVGMAQRAVPKRLLRFHEETILAVNDWHFAMMNDAARNKAFSKAIAGVVGSDTTVVDVGAGSGLLSLMAWKAGAKKVTAIEGNPDLAKMAKRVVKDNGASDRVSVISKMSTAVTADEIGGKADVLVSEILGTLLLGESAVEYITHARKTLLRPGGVVIPAYGSQYVTVISSSALAKVTHVEEWDGIKLTSFNTLKDTSSVFFSKQLGVRTASLNIVEASPRFELFHIDFASHGLEDLPREKTFTFTATDDMTLHAIMFTWDAWTDPEKQHVVTTNPAADNFEGDMAWGQAFQLVEDVEKAEALGNEGPIPFTVKRGETVRLRMFHVDTFSAIYGRLSRVPAEEDEA